MATPSRLKKTFGAEKSADEELKKAIRRLKCREALKVIWSW